jgi:hypothetical protein
VPKKAIDQSMHAWNQGPKPFIWAASVGQVIAKTESARLNMEQIKPGSTLPRANE